LCGVYPYPSKLEVIWKLKGIEWRKLYENKKIRLGSKRLDICINEIKQISI